MKIHFLGLAASEGIPNPFCRCEHCQQARFLKGKDLRTHSSAIIDDVMLIDVAPEFSQQLLRDGLDASGITDLLFTHTHPDHFNVGELFSRMEGYGFNIDHPLEIFGNDSSDQRLCCGIAGLQQTALWFPLPGAFCHRRKPWLQDHTAAGQPRQVGALLRVCDRKRRQDDFLWP